MTDWLPMDEGWIRSRLSSPLRADVAQDLALSAHLSAHRLAMSCHALDRVGSAVAYRTAGGLYEAAKRLAEVRT